ncbi:hypothetical protein AKO1_015195 [Acrasis kona]|uniref:LYR motif-containing protein 2 n=1 Tax=Acrasis kona TaxID=1008807 RepID=A0AAW2ZDP1_9EUKA
MRARGPVRDLPLQYFILRSQSLIFYRKMLRTLHRVRDRSTALELKQQIRSEFENARGVTDVAQIKSLLSDGMKRFKDLERIVSMSM